MKTRYISQFLILLLCSVVLVACGGGKDKDIEVVVEDEVPADVLFADAQTALENENYTEAVRLFNEVERLYPYAEITSQAQLMSAFSYYEDAQYEEAIVALDRYIRLYPGSENLDYAYYLRAMSYYDQISDIRRDQNRTKLAMRNFDILIDRFPDSKYARDAEYKRDLVLDHLAGKEMEIGRYYLTRHHYQAAINRFQVVVEQYDTTTHVPEALHRLVESYMGLGIEGEAYRVATVLGHNYPGSEWYQDTYNLLDPKYRKKIIAGRSTWDKAVDAVFRPN